MVQPVDYGSEMSAYELIKDLEKKLTLYRDHHPRSPSPPPNKIHALVASLICRSQLYPGRLTREVVKSLIEDRAPWPTSEGDEYCLARSVKVEILEKSRLISFPNDYLCVQRTVQIAEDMPVQLRNELNAHQFLYEIRYRGGELSSPHLRLHKSDIESSELALLDEYLVPEGDYLRLTIDEVDIFGVGTCLWKSLRITNVDLDMAFAEYVIRMSVAAERPYVFEIDFDHDVNLGEFMGCALSFIKSDQTLREDWSDCAADIALSCNRPESLTQRLPATASSVAIYADALSLQPLDGVINNLLSKPKTTLLEAITWFREGSRGGFDDRDRISDHLVWFIIAHEHNAYSVHSSFPMTQELIEHSRSAPKLINFLFFHISEPAYLCFLLSFRPTSHIGLTELYKNVARTARSISTKVNYERIWEDLVWTQGLEAYCNCFENNFEYKHVRAALESICEMVAWFADHEITRSSRTQAIADTRLPSLKNAITSLSYLTEQGYKKNLFEDHLLLIGEVVSNRLFVIRCPAAPVPLGEWLVLFWLLELAVKQPEDIGAEVPGKLCDTLISSYLQILQERRLGRANSGDDPLALDELSWSQLLHHVSKIQRCRWIYVLQEWEDRTQGMPIKESSNLNSAVRLHFRLLLQLCREPVSESVREEVVEELLSIIERFGFAPDQYSGALDYSNDSSSYSPVRLWPAFCDLTNNFSHKAYSDLLGVLASGAAPLSALLALLDKVIIQERKELVSTLIKNRDYEKESPYWVPEIFEIVLKAANNGLIPIAKYFLTTIRDNTHKTHKNKTDELTGKIELKSIFDDTNLAPQGKLELIRSFEIVTEEKEVKRSVHEYKSFLIATINTSIDNVASIKQFAQLVKSSPTLQNATGLINSALSAPSSIESARQLDEHFNTWMGIFKASIPNERNAELADENLHSVLQACLKTSRLSEFSEFWGIATNRQRGSYQFAAVRTEFLTKSGRRHEALAYVQELIAKLGDLSESALSELASIESKLLDHEPQLQPQLAPLPAPVIQSVQTDLRNSWLRIRGLSALDQSQILMEPTNSIDTYLLQIIEHVGNELLLRNANLLRKKPDSKSAMTILLDDEDMINDWLVSLIKQRVNFVGWKVHDQSRMGWSASGKGPGETDGWIEDGNGNLISIIEAFRLGNSIDKKVIKDHLDKIFGYNSTGTSPIFIVVYTSSIDFSNLCFEYESYVKGLEYKGFDGGMPNDFRRKHMDSPKAAVCYYEEARYINGSKINIYHQLLNLRMPPQ